MNHETDLHTAIAYLTDLEAEIEERSAFRGPCANSAAREDMLYQLYQTRQLVAALGHQVPNIYCTSDHNDREVLIDLHKVRTWCHVVEAKIMRICCNESAAAAA